MIHLKYIMVMDKSGFPVPILFPISVEHDRVGCGLSCLSAGFVTIGLDGVVVGKQRSHSLDLGPGENDAEDIKDALKQRPI